MSGGSPHKSSEESLAAQPGSPRIDWTNGRQHLMRSPNVLHDVHIRTLGPYRPTTVEVATNHRFAGNCAASAPFAAVRSVLR